MTATMTHTQRDPWRTVQSIPAQRAAFVEPWNWSEILVDWNLNTASKITTASEVFTSVFLCFHFFPHIFEQTSSAQINLLLWLFCSLYCILIFWPHNMLTSDSLLCTRGFVLPSAEKTNAWSHCVCEAAHQSAGKAGLLFFFLLRWRMQRDSSCALRWSQISKHIKRKKKSLFHHFKMSFYFNRCGGVNLNQHLSTWKWKLGISCKNKFNFKSPLYSDCIL